MDAIIVPCTQEKVWDRKPNAGPVPAKDAYTKPAFLAWRAYAERSGSTWCILSTKYGLIAPDQKIEPYNTPVSAALRDPRFLNLLAQQGRDLNLSQFERIVLLDWEKFEPLVRTAIGTGTSAFQLQKVRY